MQQASKYVRKISWYSRSGTAFNSTVTRNRVEPKGIGINKNVKFTLLKDQMKWATDPPSKKWQVYKLSIIILFILFLSSLKVWRVTRSGPIYKGRKGTPQSTILSSSRIGWRTFYGIGCHRDNRWLLHGWRRGFPLPLMTCSIGFCSVLDDIEHNIVLRPLPVHSSPTVDLISLFFTTPLWSIVHPSNG